MSVTTPRLDEPIIAGDSIRSVNFFNGRLLTGDDLRREQTAERARLARLGEAAGDGVARGLEVAAIAGSALDEPAVTVDAGLAVAPSGVVLELAQDTELSLVRDGPRPGSEPGGLFADCEPVAGGTYTAGSGVYLLAVGPASKGEGLAPVSGLHNEEATCNVAYSAEGVRFRLIRLALPADELADEARLRNRVAYRMFGTQELAGLERDPFGPAIADWGQVARLRETVLDDDEVPLATIGWKAAAGIRFVDLWSVRRRLVRGGASDRWAALAGERRTIEGEARLLQFQQHVAERARAGVPERVKALSVFDRLPPAGLLPIAGAGPGYDLPTFFLGVKTRGPFFVPAPRVLPLLRASLTFPPVELAQQELIWTYHVRENRDGSVAGDALARPYAVFASGFIPYAGQPQYDLSRWDYANYALHAS
jgi:hypothetical protein